MRIARETGAPVEFFFGVDEDREARAEIGGPIDQRGGRRRSPSSTLAGPTGLTTVMTSRRVPRRTAQDGL